MSTILSEKKTLSPWAKGGIGLGAGALLLVLVGLLFPTAAAFFPLVSLWCSCVLFYGALWVLHTAGVELDFFHRAAIIAFWAGAVLYFYWGAGAAAVHLRLGLCELHSEAVQYRSSFCDGSGGRF